MLLRFFIVYIFFFNSIKAQTPYHYSLSEESGLPSSEVYQVKQDSFGFIWIGCDAGLYRYDGIRFKEYNFSKENGRSKSELKFDGRGRLWCQNFTGQIFFLDQDSLQLFHDFSKDFRIFPSYTVDKENFVWIATEKAIQRYDLSGKKINELHLIHGMKDTIPWNDIEVTSAGKVFATSYFKGLCEITNNNGQLKAKQKQPIRKEYGRMSIEVLKSGLYVIEEAIPGKNYNVYRLVNDSLSLLLNISDDCFVYKLAEDHSDGLWLCTSKGIRGLNKNNRSAGDRRILSTDKISSFTMDKEGNIWLTSLQNGVHIIPNMNLYLIGSENQKIDDNYISAITLGANNAILAGTYSGRVFVSEGEEVDFNKMNHSLGFRTVKKIIPYKEGYLISRGVFQYIDKKRQLEVPSLRNARDFCVLRDTIYFITSHSSGYFPVKDIFNKVTSPQIKTGVIQQKAGRSIVADSTDGRLFLASNEGVFEYARNQLKEIKWNNERINASKLYLHKGVLWIATVNDGLITLLNGKIDEQTELNKALKGRRIKTLKIDTDYLWIATEVCLNKINLNNKSASYFDLSDGLLSKEINDVLFTHDLVYLATNKGIIRMLKNNPSINNVPPEIKITGVQLNDVYCDPRQLSSLAYNKSKLAIHFIATCMRARGNFLYMYRLIGLDSGWTSLSALSNSVVYPSLPPGDYIFEVKARNEDGIESVHAQKISFSISKPFWQTWWFYVCVAASGAVLVLLIAVSALRNIRNKAQIKNDLISSQLTAIRAQMNPHFMYNTLNSIQDLIIKGDIKHTNYYLSKFSSLMRKILEFSENEKVILSEEVEMLKNYLELEKLRFGEDFSFEISLDDNLDQMRTFIPSLIIQPFAENAIKHGLLHKKGLKKISVRFVIVDEHYLEAIIEDNGIGRERSEEIKQRSKLRHKSFANSAVQKRLELLNKSNPGFISLEIVDLYAHKEAIGTRVVLRIKRL